MLNESSDREPHSQSELAKVVRWHLYVAVATLIAMLTVQLMVMFVSILAHPAAFFQLDPMTSVFPTQFVN